MMTVPVLNYSRFLPRSSLVLVLGNLYYLYRVLVFVREMSINQNATNDTGSSVMEVFALFAFLTCYLANFY